MSKSWNTGHFNQNKSHCNWSFRYIISISWHLRPIKCHQNQPVQRATWWSTRNCTMLFPGLPMTLGNSKETCRETPIANFIMTIQKQTVLRTAYSSTHVGMWNKNMYMYMYWIDTCNLCKKIKTVNKKQYPAGSVPAEFDDLTDHVF